MKVELRFKSRFEFDPVVAKALLENVVARLEEYATIETPLKLVDDRACFVMLRPLSQKVLKSKGLLVDPETRGDGSGADGDYIDERHLEMEEEVSAARERAISREEKHRLAQLETEELRQQGLLKKRFKSPTEQTKGGDGKDSLPGANTASSKKSPASGSSSGAPSSGPTRNAPNTAPRKKPSNEEDEDFDDGLEEEGEEDERLVVPPARSSRR